jgi:16S rRNA G966 N2-methylase RsmD
MHKYWARKPHNVVRKYIESLSDKGDVVLDPFAGSGVTLIEALKTGRRGVAVDVNPISTLITKGSIVEVNKSELLDAFRRIEKKVQTKIAPLFETLHPETGQKEKVTHVVWESQAPCPNCDGLINLKSAEKVGRKSTCPACGEVTYLTSGDVTNETMREVWFRDSSTGDLQKKEPTDYDRQLIKECEEANYSSVVEGQFMHANKRTLVHEDYTVESYFTARNARCLSLIIQAIKEEDDGNIRQVLELAFTGGVAQASRLIPYRDGLKSGGPAWSVPGFWIPKLHFEINAWDCFKHRFEKVLKGKKQMSKELRTKPVFADQFSDLSRDANTLILNTSATNLEDQVPDNSVDYIFTDPPYGDSVPYLEYSKLWFSWLDEEADFDSEVVISDSNQRRKDLDNYATLLESVFKECFRVLKPKGWMSLTFNNRKLEVWDALVSGAISAGFDFDSCLYQVPAVISSKAQLARAGSTIGDVILNFKKGERGESKTDQVDSEEVPHIVLKEAERIIAERNGEARIEEITRGVVVALLNRGLFGLGEHDITSILERRFVEEDSNWRLKANERHLVDEYPNLKDEIERIVENALMEGADGEKEVMAKVFSELTGERTPSTARIVKAYQTVQKRMEEERQPELFS